MSLKDFLVQGEEMLARAGGFYATNSRLIKYKKDSTGETLDEIAYSKIKSLDLERNMRFRLMAAGLILVLFGALGPDYVPALLETFGVTWHTGYKYIGYGLSGLGIILFLAGAIWRNAYYQLRASGINKKEWRVKRPYSKNARKLAQAVREHLNR